MAHACPECGYTCHCGGDIEDCIIEGTREEARCTHCDLFDNYDDEDDYLDDDEGVGE